MKVRDIVEVPHIDKIVRLTDNMADTADKDKLESLLKGYVMTGSVEKNLDNFFYKVTNFQDKGQGFLISGLPGAGKSHFMTVLGALVKSNAAFDLLKTDNDTLQKAKTHFMDKKVFVVSLMAEEGGPGVSLEQMFFSAAEKITGFPFTDNSYFIIKFEEAIMANVNYKHKVDEFVSSYTDNKFKTWADFKQSMNDDRSITKLIQAFIEAEEITFFNPDRGRKDKLDYLYKWLAEEEYDGILVLIDELSEYLMDRGGNARDDALFLKTFLENSSTERNGRVIPAWIVGSFLSALEDITVPNVTDLMKDRFPTENHFFLKIDDVEEIIDQRLVIKTRPDKVEEAFHLLSNKYNAFEQVEKETFKKIYPLHPETLEILSKSVRFLSRQRSIVDFVLSEVKGNADDGGRSQGIMDENYLQMVTPDKIFSHFQERIRELSDKREYFDSIYSYYMGPEGLGNGKVKDLFKDNDDDRKMAAKLIDLLTLLKINELEKNYTVKDLTYMIQYPKLEKEFAEAKVNKILKKMYDEGEYIEIGEENSDADVGSNVYYVNKDVSISNKIKQKIKPLMTNVDGSKIVSIVPEIVKTLNQDPIPISQMFDEPYGQRVRWNHTNRDGVIQFNELNKIASKENLSAALRGLKDKETDYYLYIGTIFDQKKQKEFIDQGLNALNSGNQKVSLFAQKEESKETEKRLLKSIIYWLPSDELDREEEQKRKDKLREFHAYTELYKELDKQYKETHSKEAKEMLDKVGEKKLNLEDEVFEVLKGLYLGGTFYNVEGKLDVDISSYGNESLNRIVKLVLDKVLSQVFDKNQFIAPNEFLGLTDNSTNRFINEFIFGDKVELTGLEKGIVENVVKKFGSVKEQEKAFKFSVDFNNNQFVKMVVKELEDRVEGISYGELYKKIRKSEYGPDKSTTEILMAMLIKKGFLIPLKYDEPINLSEIKAPLSSSISKFKMGEFVDDVYYEGLMRIAKLFFDKRYEKQDLAFQEEFWEELLEYKQGLANRLTESINILLAKRDELGLKKEDFEQTYRLVEYMQDILETIEESNGSKDGLEYFVDQNKKDILNGVVKENYDKCIQFMDWVESDILTDIISIDRKIEDYKKHIYQKPQYQDLFQLTDEIKELMKNGDQLIWGNSVTNINEKFRLFEEKYKSKYIEEHSEQNNQIEFEELKDLKISDNYRFLSSLSSITKINMDYDYINIEEDINRQLRFECKETPINRFNDGEVCCLCNFKLGQKNEIRGKGYFEPAVNKAIQGYIDELNSKANKDKVNKYINSLREIGEQQYVVEKVENMYEIELNNNRVEKYRDFLMSNAEVIPFIDKALQVDINIIPRDISKLVEVFKDKPYSKREMIEKFTRLLEGNGEVSQNHYIKFTDLKNEN
ncbi:hypothetical protein PRVXH_001818 [Proteinivorax hydrogeniformans]|uniref:Uncharacterized protein n=1 Tax=Proteinivorax hydrogeniformans TaxID=1826727 RepID=A0AAU8HQR6_9FIRM